MNEAPTHAPPSPAPPAPAAPRAAWIAFVCLLAYLAATRLLFLGLKPVQHDESMFAYYSYGITQGLNYEFMPILHGPLLEWATAGVFQLLGDSDATMRLFPALCGVGIAVALWTLRRSIGPRAALLSIAYIAGSPTLLFFSRFIRNDIPFLFVAMVMVSAFAAYGRRGSPVPLVVAMLGAALAVSIKETYVIFFFILAAFAAACGIYGAVHDRAPSAWPVTRHVFTAFRRRPITLAFSSGLGIFLVIALYSSFFHYPAHWDGVVEALRYWSEEHQKHRIEGPYHFYLIHLAIYELPLLLFWLAALVHGFWRLAPEVRSRGMVRAVQGVWFAGSLVALALFWRTSLPEGFADLTYMALGLHAWMAVQIVAGVSVACWKHLNRGKPFHAFADCWTGASLVIYSYAGEKVPWVTAHIALPLTLACALHADGLLTAMPSRAALPRPFPRLAAAARIAGGAAAALGFAAMLALSLYLAFVNNGNPIERHTYASSHPQFHRAVRGLTDEAIDSVMGYDSRIAFKGEVTWPLWWSLRKFDLKTPEVYAGTFPPYVIVDEYEHQAGPAYWADYDWQRVRFRHYWQPRPLDADAMLRLDLLIRGENNLPEAERDLRRRASTDWLKLLKATFLREEDIEGPTRWDELGGLDAYIGRLKPGIGADAAASRP